MNTEIRIVSWNVLAAPWAAAQWYPEAMDPGLLERTRRSALVSDHLRSLRPALACLQETTPPDLTAAVAGLEGDFDVHFASNDESFWSNWLGPDTAWEPNGAAVVWDARRFAALDRGSIVLAAHGNVATWVRLRADDGELLVVSVHLDSDDPDRRMSELPALFELVADEPRVIVAGDYNQDTLATDLGAAYFERGFVDVGVALGVRGPTHPIARPEDDWAALATIDHIMVRGVTPKLADIVDAGTWAESVPGARIEELLRRTGSDHLAVVADLEIVETG